MECASLLLELKRPRICKMTCCIQQRVVLMTDEDAQTEKSSSSSSKKKKAKATKPTFVKSEGTIYRFLLAFFAQDMRPYVIELGHQPTKNDLDSHRILHYGILFNKLAKVYNDSEREDLETLSTHDDFYINSNVANDVPSKFDILTAEDMSDVFQYLNFWYKNRMRRCLRSGSHDMYANFVRGLPFLFLYWTLQQDGPIEIQNLAMPHLSRRAPVSNASPVPIVQRRRVRKTQNLVSQMEINWRKQCERLRPNVLHLLQYVTLLKRLLLPFMSRSMWFNINQVGGDSPCRKCNNSRVEKFVS